MIDWLESRSVHFLCLLMTDLPITEYLTSAQAGHEFSRNQIARWLLQHVRNRVQSISAQRHLPDSVSAIQGDVLTKLMRSGVIDKAVNRGYLIGATTQAINEIIADAARSQNRQKRKAAGQRMPAEMLVDCLEREGTDVIGLTDALRDLQEREPRLFQVVTLRYFGGMTIVEVAKELNISIHQVKEDWASARRFLFLQLHPEAAQKRDK